MAEPPPPELIARCDAPASMDHWDQFNGFVEQQADVAFGACKTSYQLRLACEELLSNIIRHAPGAHIWLEAYRYLEPAPGLLVQIEDNGPHFDPQLDAPRHIDITQPIDERPIGGLGLFLVQNSVDQLDYAWINDRNRYRLLVHQPQD
jgi:anti-sigma regulatory factor (Ser/Thr protein kinase)